MKFSAPAGLCFLGVFLGLSSAQIPFPDVWDPNPLRFPYAPEESTYLPKSSLPPVGVRGLGAGGGGGPKKQPAPPAQPMQPRSFTLPQSARRSIRVLIQDGVATLSLSAKGGSRLQFKRADGSVSKGPAFSGWLRIERRNGEFRVAPRNSHPFSAGPAVALRFLPADPRLPLEVEGKVYRGSVEIFTDGADLQCVNSLGLEDYLRGVLPLEMGHPEESALEALKAQAVVARTFAVKRMLEAPAISGGFDVHASVQDQMYGGAEAESPLSDSAVLETRDWALLHADTLALCYYHSTCGGVTASRHEVWGGPVIPYLLSRSDRDASGLPWCRASKYMQWTQSWDAGSLAAILRANAGESIGAFRKLIGLRVQSRFACGRVRVLEIETDRGAFELRGDKIRFALKPGSGTGRILESARFDIEFSGGRVIARGSGFGHGIGLCQMGALARAQAGQSCAQILAAYYPGTEIGRMK